MPPFQYSQSRSPQNPAQNPAQKEYRAKLLIHPEYQHLRIRIRHYRARIAAVLLTCYLSFLFVFVSFPNVLLEPVSAQNPTPWLIPAAIMLILLQFLVTGVYVKQMNTIFDEELERIRREVEVSLQ